MATGISDFLLRYQDDRRTFRTADVPLPVAVGGRNAA